MQKQRDAWSKARYRSMILLPCLHKNSSHYSPDPFAFWNGAAVLCCASAPRAGWEGSLCEDLSSRNSKSDRAVHKCWCQVRPQTDYYDIMWHTQPWQRRRTVAHHEKVWFIDVFPPTGDVCGSFAKGNTRRTTENTWDYAFRIMLHYMHEINPLLTVQEWKKERKKNSISLRSFPSWKPFSDGSSTACGVYVQRTTAKCWTGHQECASHSPLIAWIW